MGCGASTPAKERPSDAYRPTELPYRSDAGAKPLAKKSAQQEPPPRFEKFVVSWSPPYLDANFLADLQGEEALNLFHQLGKKPSTPGYVQCEWLLEDFRQVCHACHPQRCLLQEQGMDEYVYIYIYI